MPSDHELSCRQERPLSGPAAEAAEADRASAGNHLHGGLSAYRRLRSSAHHGGVQESAPPLVRAELRRAEPEGVFGMSRTLSLLFAIICYAIFFATFLYLIAFVGDLALVPKTVNAPPSTMPRITKAVIDVALIALFGLQ